jgi:hypothetical protein
MSLEYRSASSNINFHGASDWEPWDHAEDTAEDIEIALCEGGRIPDGLEMVLDFSGFEWSVETRETSA